MNFKKDFKYDLSRLYTYDIEIFPNFFVLKARNITTGKEFLFEISPRRDDSHLLLSFLRTIPTLIGYNNLNFDYRLLEAIINMMVKEPKLKRSEMVTRLKLLANSIVEEKFRSKPRRVLIPQIDLMVIPRFDKRKISLKELEFAMRMENIETLPFPHDKVLTEEDMGVIINSYLPNDIEATSRFYEIMKNEIIARYEASIEYQYDMMNLSNPVMGERIFRLLFKKEYGTDDLGKTVNEYIDVKDVLFDYISFNEEPFKRIHNFFKSQRIYQLKGAFSKIPFENLAELEGYYERIKTVGVQKNLNVIFDGITCVYGVGGIHGSIRRAIIESNDEYIILDLDVSSFYPNLAIKNRFYPRHLGEIFCDIMEREYDARQRIPKTDSRNKSKKELINSVFGKSNEEFSFFFDSSYTVKTTVNGQLLLSMLAENIIRGSEESKLIQVNTDGVSVLIKRSDFENVEGIYKAWEALTKLKLEAVVYKKMIIRDCNNYIWIKENGDRKRKGAYEWKPDIEKDHSMLIVPKAVENFYLTGETVEDFINRHEDIYDFMLRGKVDSSSKLIIRKEGSEDIVCQRLSRYYISKEGGTLLKIMKPIITEENQHLPKYAKYVADKEKYISKFSLRETNLQSGWLVTIANDLRNINKEELLSSINREYYIKEARKLLIGTEECDSSCLNEEEDN